MRDVVISGMGTIGSYGAGVDALRGALATGTQTLREVDRAAGLHRQFGARMAHLVDPASVQDWLRRAAARRLSPPSKLAVAATRMAAVDAGLSEEACAGGRTSVSMGVGLGTSYATRILDQMAELGPMGAAPMLFIESVSNAAAGQMAVLLGARGPNLTITQHQASGLLAVLSGADHVRSGRSDLAFVGVVDEMSPIAHVALDRFGSLARPGGGTDAGETTRPFAANRGGFVAAEGATVLVLEAEERAAQRGAQVIARVRGGIRANDPTAPSTSWGTGGEGLAAVFRRGLHRLGVELDSIDRVYSGASGSRPGDRIEAEVLRRVFGDAPGCPPIVAPKALLGEYGGGFLGAATLGLDPHPGTPVPPGGSAALDPELGIELHGSEPLPSADRIALTTLAAGGSAAWLLLDRSP